MQNETEQYPPREGNATVTWAMWLLYGWLPEARYFAHAKITDGNETVVDLWTEFDMKLKGDYRLNLNPSVDPPD